MSVYFFWATIPIVWITDNDCRLVNEYRMTAEIYFKTMAECLEDHRGILHRQLLQFYPDAMISGACDETT
jgi:hypothetical protein